MKPLLALYGHPFSSYTQKVLTALHETGMPYELRNLDPGAPGDHAAEWQRRWPLAKFPLLVDGERTVVDTSIIIEHLQLAHPGRWRWYRTTLRRRCRCGSWTASSTCT